jgi:hypothetical protein
MRGSILTTLGPDLVIDALARAGHFGRGARAAESDSLLINHLRDWYGSAQPREAGQGLVAREEAGAQNRKCSAVVVPGGQRIPTKACRPAQTR